MKSISGKNLCKIVEKKGWILKKITGSHHIYEKADENKIISIPVHKNQDLKLGTLKSIMKIAELVEDDL
ncbi:type II toxin-antitoxin system HicA family toxin [Cronbergia sp. UHCC 0137]|uniref:type II toxin-antitoxin system HicA family toxin n=1 Tax=Cronbergia sp. UHCC 0137 TaxID=3110239 RepID=UPI002B1ED781|nr:type II toxin-antitoxin system HicA family toxin [Cronbergia sp. UHCC 0137]MEA5620621.1 type II toxin-antitoxin system HicA family toxin [Cronbergia sp. UHCC 0137]